MGDIKPIKKYEAVLNELDHAALDKAAETYASIQYINTDGQWCSAGINPVKKEAFMEGFKTALKLVKCGREEV